MTFCYNCFNLIFKLFKTNLQLKNRSQLFYVKLRRTKMQISLPLSLQEVRFCHEISISQTQPFLGKIKPSVKGGGACAPPGVGGPKFPSVQSF